MLRLKQMIQQTPTVWDLVFEKPQGFSFKPGQYMEWTLPHSKPDARGNRRYFTIASSPTESEVRLGIKFGSSLSSFKKGFGSLNSGEIVAAGSLAGDFTLPKNLGQGCVLIGGGIGVTPYRSMAQWALTKGEKRPVTLICTAKTEAELAYKGLFDRCWRELGWRVIYLVGQTSGEAGQNVYLGKIDEELLRQVVRGGERVYVSGQHSMVEDTRKKLSGIGVSGRDIKTDYFPGLV